MKAHNIIMAILVVLAIVLIFIGPTLNIGSEFGILLLICPLMMLGMMYFMRDHGKHDK